MLNFLLTPNSSGVRNSKYPSSESSVGGDFDIADVGPVRKNPNVPNLVTLKNSSNSDSVFIMISEDSIAFSIMLVLLVLSSPNELTKLGICGDDCDPNPSGR
jgi:hypothetical protein